MTVRSKRSVLPPGARWVGLGVVVSGLSAYIFLAWTARHLGPANYAPLAAFWSLTYLVGPGCFGILEKEVGRQLSFSRAAGFYPAPITRRIGQLGLGLAAILMIAAVALTPTLQSSLFSGSALLAWSFVISLAAMWAQHMAWGVLAGNRDFVGYGLVNAGEGLFRLAGCAVLVAVGVGSPGPFGLAIALAPAAVAVMSIRSLRRAQRWGADISRTVISKSLLYLLGSVFFYSVLVNGGTVAIKILARPGQEVLTGNFLSGLVIVRVPLFLYSSASATLLPALSAQAGAGDWASFSTTLRRLSGIVVLVGVVSTVLAGLVGPSAVHIVFGPAYSLRGPDLALLAGSAAGLLLASTLSVALTASGSLASLVVCWGLGLATTAGLIALVQPLFERVELGLLGGSCTAALAMVAAIKPVIDHRRTSSRRDFRAPARARSRGVLGNDSASPGTRSEFDTRRRAGTEGYAIMKHRGISDGYEEPWPTG